MVQNIYLSAIKSNNKYIQSKYTRSYIPRSPNNYCQHNHMDYMYLFYGKTGVMSCIFGNMIIV